jgi:hypothetical protein
VLLRPGTSLALLQMSVTLHDVPVQDVTVGNRSVR